LCIYDYYCTVCAASFVCDVLCTPGAEFKIVSEFKETGQSNPVFNALVQASGKMVLIDKLLTKLKESGHKVKNHAYE